MKRRIWLAFVLFALAATPPARAANAVAGGSTEPQPLRAGETLAGRFVQERHLLGLAAPLRSSGRFVLAAGKGLVWHGETPFDAIVVITPSGLQQLVDGQVVQSLPAARAPFLARLYDMLGGALGGDWSALSRDFSVERTAGDAGWTIVLKPLHAGEAGAAPLQSITITGRAFVDGVDIRHANGDWEHIAFSDQTRSRKPLAADAAHLLDMSIP